MEPGYTIVVGSQDTLCALCGVNDSNLKAIEKYLGAPLVTKGNELTVASNDTEIWLKFQILIEKLVTGADSLCPDQVAALIDSLSVEVSGSVSESYIQIPNGLKRIYPKSVKQAELIRLLQKYEMVFAIGPAGTGKTFLAVAEALRLVLSRQVRKMVITRPVVEAGENLGFLPGDLEQKINPYLRPIYDAIEALLPPEMIKRMEDAKMLEIAPLAYMRGRTLDNCIIILDEAQNTTKEQMKMFLTRLGQGSRAIITGDPTQTDLPGHRESGLMNAVRIVSGIPEIAVIHLENRDVIRNYLVKKIVHAYEQETK